MLPHAIIVFNATDISVDEDEWNIARATQMLMTDIHDAIFREPALQEHGTSILSLLDIISSPFSVSIISSYIKANVIIVC